MPTYDFKCLACNKRFTLILTVAERDRGVRCPKCNSKRVEQKISSFFAKTSRKS